MRKARTLQPSRGSVRLRAAQLHALAHFRIDSEGLDHEITLDAPDGHVWKCSDVHQLVMAGADGTPMVELCADALDRMSHGIARCDDTDCDVCHPAKMEAAQ